MFSIIGLGWKEGCSDAERDVAAVSAGELLADSRIGRNGWHGIAGLLRQSIYGRHGRYVTFQMAEAAIPRDLFADILRRIDRLRPTPLPT